MSFLTISISAKNPLPDFAAVATIAAKHAGRIVMTFQVTLSLSEHPKAAM